MDSYVVRRARPSEARAVLEGLWERNLPIRQSASSKFRWLYEEAPAPCHDVFVLATEARGEIPAKPVGTAGFVLRQIFVGPGSGARPEILRAAVLADVAVDREHRTLGPALRLVREARAWALAELDMSYGLPNAHAQGVVRRVGYAVLGAMTRYARVLRHEHYLDRVSPEDLQRLPSWSQGVARAIVDPAATGTAAALARKVAVASLDAAQLARDGRKVAHAYRAHRFSVAPSPPEGIDALFERCRGEYDIVAVRSRALLSWRYPGDAKRFWVAAQSGGRLDAYAVVDMDAEVFHIRDLFGSRAAVSALLSYLVVESYKRGAAALSMRFLGEPWLVALLEELRFVKRSDDRAVHLSLSPKVTGSLRERLAEPQCWYFTDFDEDV